MWCVVPLIADKKEGGVLPTSTQQPVPSTPHNASIEVEEPWTAADAAMKKWYHSCYPKQHCSHSQQHLHQTPSTSSNQHRRLSANFHEAQSQHLWVWGVVHRMHEEHCDLFTITDFHFFSWIHPHPKKKKCCHVSCWWCWVMLNYWNWNSLWSVSLSPGLHAESSTLFDRCISINPHAMRTSGQVMVVCIQLSDTPSTPHRALYIVYEYY